MQFPPAFLPSLSGVEGFNQQAFFDIHQSGEQVTSIRLNPAKLKDPAQLGFYNDIKSNIPWCENGFYLNQRPSFTFDPLLHAGCYYVQEASSMFLEQAIKQTTDPAKSLRVLDLCAAPGGKSTHLQSLMSEESLLISNEIIQTRANILTDNLMRWGAANTIVSRNDPAAFSMLPGFFDVVVVDAPCSGSGLFRREPVAVKEWTPANVQVCCERQQKIVRNIWPALKEGGILIYSTCSYSKEEDEDILDWMMNNFSAENIPLKVPGSADIIETASNKSGALGYRFFPDKILGEGFFLSCFKKINADHHQTNKKIKKPEITGSKNQAILQSWINEKNLTFCPFFDKITAIPNHLLNDFSILSGVLNIRYAGILMGEMIREKLIPHHSLALSTFVSQSINRLNLEREKAIIYLQRKELKTETNAKGWQLAAYNDHPIGWVNVLPNRINNYYPKEMKILKEIE